MEKPLKAEDSAIIEDGEGENSRREKNPKWWQHFFLYPIFGLAVLSAVPTWFGGIERFTTYLINRGIEPATELRLFMEKNPDCVVSPFRWVEVSESTDVDGTICSNTGDVFLRIRTEENRVVYKGIDISKLIPVKIAQIKSPLMGAHAATSVLSGGAIGSKSNSEFEFAQMQQMAIVVCQKFLNDNTLLRHIRVGPQCYDEIVNTANGLVQSNSPVACRNTC